MKKPIAALLCLLLITPAYAIDPQSFDVLEPCGYTQEELEYAVSGEMLKGLQPYAGVFLEAEKEYGVNAFYLMCKMGLESGWGRYRAAENNIAGWRCDDGSYKAFANVQDCIMHVAESIATLYTDPADWRHTGGTTLKAVCGRYCQDKGYVDTLVQIMEEREAKINECSDSV